MTRVIRHVWTTTQSTYRCVDRKTANGPLEQAWGELNGVREVTVWRTNDVLEADILDSLNLPQRRQEWPRL